MRIHMVWMTALAMVIGLGVSSASALDIDLNIEDIYVGPTPGPPSVGDLMIDPSGDLATATLAAGNVVELSITVSNPTNISIAGIFLSIVTDGPQVNFLGANPVAPSILQGGTFFDPLALTNVGSGAVKVNSPVQNDGSPGEMWVQALAFGSGLGSDGAGPDNAITLFYSVTGASGDDEVSFILELTAGDGIEDTSQNPIDANISSAAINVPEPASIALAFASLGTVALVSRVRRRV